MAARPFAEVFYDVKSALRLTNQGMANLLEVGLRSIERNGHLSVNRPFTLVRLVRAVHPVNRALAVEAASAFGATLVELGIESAPAPTPPKDSGPSAVLPESVALPQAQREHADSVLLAAARAMDMTPNEVLPAVEATLVRAAEMGVDLGSLAILFGAKPSTQAKAVKAADKKPTKVPAAKGR